MNLLGLSFPNAHLTRVADFDLIHCAHCLSKNENKPWVADFESEWQMYVGEKTFFGKKSVDKIISKDNCKKIIPWTNGAKRELENRFPKLKNKFEVVYPAVPLMVNNKQYKKQITLLFIARYFYQKGGLHALEAINRLTKKYNNVSGIFISQTPSEIINKYSSNKKIKFYNLMPQQRLFKEIFPLADIFVYPGYTDSFGFALLEAMSFGIPIVTVDGFARKEIVDDGKTGFVVEKDKDIDWRKITKNEEEIIEKLVDKTSLLTEDAQLRAKMSKNCFKEIKNGKFSIKERNKKLEKIYAIAAGKL